MYNRVETLLASHMTEWSALATRHVHEAGTNFARDQLPQASPMPGQFDFVFHNTHGPPPGAAPS